MNKNSIIPLVVVVIVLLTITIITDNKAIYKWFHPDKTGFITNDYHSANEPFITIDSKNNPHITWNESVTSDIFYLKHNGKRLVNADGKKYDMKNGVIMRKASYTHNPKIALDSNDYPHIIWTEKSKIVYIKWNGANWVSELGEIFDLEMMSSHISNDYGSSSARFVLDSNDYPHVVFCNSYATRDANNYYTGQIDRLIYMVKTGFAGIDRCLIGIDRIYMQGQVATCPCYLKKNSA